MKIATYNLWDSPAGMPRRFWQQVTEIRRTEADILCLQECGNREIHEQLARQCGYSRAHFHEKAGLSILSRVPFLHAEDFNGFALVSVQKEGSLLCVVNVHLPWDSVLRRERIAVHIMDQIRCKKHDCVFLAGDFNSSADSSVHRFLLNQQSLAGREAYFFDLAEAYAETKGTVPDATLDFRKNPRWGRIDPPNTLETNQRCDWIMLQNVYPAPLPKLEYCTLFGTEKDAETGLCPSDHYGVAAELTF